MGADGRRVSGGWGVGGGYSTRWTRGAHALARHVHLAEALLGVLVKVGHGDARGEPAGGCRVGTGLRAPGCGARECAPVRGCTRVSRRSKCIFIQIISKSMVRARAFKRARNREGAPRACPRLAEGGGGGGGRSRAPCPRGSPQGARWRARGGRTARRSSARRAPGARANSNARAEQRTAVARSREG